MRLAKLELQVIENIRRLEKSVHKRSVLAQRFAIRYERRYPVPSLPSAELSGYISLHFHIHVQFFRHDQCWARRVLR